mmetsp:Transcript_23933/g.27386  ORF Transcript_23933/g.27386 Transcript_23933/m.27386 type:complete len:97 (-) Transcript_23933:118-408(-)
MTIARSSSSYLQEVLIGFLVLDMDRNADSEDESDDDSDDDDDDEDDDDGSELKYIVDGMRASLVAQLLCSLLLLSSSSCGSFILVIIEEYTLVMIQ